jgi:ABC-type nitrate/sulfonate/bicarbonate transport system substrate-binding protein
MSQSMPWIAQETGIFRKYNLEFPLVYIGTSPLATAAMLGGEAQILIDGGVGLVRTVLGGNNDLVFIAGIKNHLTQSILAKPEIKRLEDLRGKKIGVTRIGATTHYFAVQAFKQRNMEAGRDYSMIQTGGAPEMLAALLSGAIDAGTMSAPWDARAISQEYSYVVYGPGPAHSASRGVVDYAPLLYGAELAAHRPIHARHGGGREGLAHGQRDRFQSLEQVPAHRRQKGFGPGL